MNTLSILLSLALVTLTTANGNLPGSCLKDGTTINPPGTVPGGGIYSSYCPSGYGRPQGVCNCISGLNSCLANLAGCPGAEKGTFVPAIPPTLYVGTHYEFKINISFASPSNLCFQRPLPAGLSWVQLYPDAPGMEQQYAISGTPTESMPSADYGVAAKRSQALGGFSVFFTFEIQSCSLDDAVYPTSAPTPAPTAAPSIASPPSSESPPSPPSLPTTPSTTCSAQESGNMRCGSDSNTYQTCDRGVWQPSQSCGSGLKCQPQGPSVYCVRA